MKTEATPPKKLLQLLAWACPAFLYEGIEGDLLEQFHKDVDEYGIKVARRHFYCHALLFLRPGILLRNSFSFKIINNMMWSNYFKVAVRNIYKRKLFSLINAIGLSISIAFCLLIYLYINNDRSFDRFNTNADRIYRIEEKSYRPILQKDEQDPYYHSAYLQLGLRDAILDEVPQVEYATRFSGSGDVILKNGEKKFIQEVKMVDPDFFHMFSFPVIKGDPTKFLSDKYEIVLTKEMAEKLFGDSEPLDQVISLNYFGKQDDFTVVGVVQNPQANSSIDFSALIPIQNKPYYSDNISRWNSFNTPLFVQLLPNSTTDDFDKGLDRIIEKNMRKSLEEQRVQAGLTQDVELFDYEFTALKDIHMNAQIPWNRSSNPQYSYILSAISLLILLIACINYVSLSLTSSAGRRMEVGIRKAIGAGRSQLLSQFTLESITLAFISLIMSVGLVFIFLPKFNEYTDKNIQLNSQDCLYMVLFGLGITVFLGLISGFYPSFFLSSIKPTQVLKGGNSSRIKAGFTRPLVVIQFTLSTFLIISSIIMYRQMKFITTKDLGYDQHQIITIPLMGGNTNASDRFVEQFRQNSSDIPGVDKVTGISTAFTTGWSTYGYRINGEQKSAFFYVIDPFFLNTLHIDLVKGRNFRENFSPDTTAIIVNQALVKDMGWENPLEEHLNWREDSLGNGYKIIGVVNDFHFLSLETNIEPMFFALPGKETDHMHYLMVRISPNNMPVTIDKLRKLWESLNLLKPFQYTFLDQDVQHQYASYDRWMKIMGLATFFALLISCLGLFGLAGVNAVNRTKEIGIRKVMGAEIMNILVLMNRQFLLLAVIAFIIASPLAWYIMNKWLADFEFSIAIGWEIFLYSILIGILLALLTVSYHSIKAAMINPADTLKHE